MHVCSRTEKWWTRSVVTSRVFHCISCKNHRASALNLAHMHQAVFFHNIYCIICFCNISYSFYDIPFVIATVSLFTFFFFSIFIYWLHVFFSNIILYFFVITLAHYFSLPQHGCLPFSFNRIRTVLNRFTSSCYVICGAQHVSYELNYKLQKTLIHVWIF